MRFTRAYIYKVYLLTLLTTFILGCQSDGIVDSSNDAKGDAITFNGSNQAVTRATENNLHDYITSFRLYGVKHLSENNYQTVFNNYQVDYIANSAGTTESNTYGWEYVGIHDNQTIKYCDYAANPYIFWAVGNADKLSGFTESDGTIKEVSIDVNESELNHASTIVYYTKPTIVKKEQYNNTVVLQFYQAISRVRFAFYETIPGYAVKDVKFYITDTSISGYDTPKDNCVINSSFVSNGKMKLNYEVDETTHDNSSVTVSYAETPTKETETYKTFGSLNYTSGLLGTISSNATYAGTGPGYYTNILPYPGNTTPLSLKIDYTLVSEDGYGQEIQVTGATAIVPSNYCQWKSNYSYTYLFKLTDSKLTPITFVGWSEIGNTIDNQQGTITTLGDYSITTYQAGSTDEGGIDYKTGKDMEVTVVQNVGEGGSSVLQQVELDGTNNYVVIYHQSTNKEWVVETECPTDPTPCAGQYKETIEGGGTTNGYENNKAHFTPDVTGTYRVEYWHKNTDGTTIKLAVKIVKIHGEDTEIEEYEKWQSGVSGNTTW